MEKNWFMLSDGTDARTLTEKTGEMEEAIKKASSTCQDIEKQLSECYIPLLKIFGSTEHGFTPINKTNVLERCEELKNFLQTNYTLFKAGIDLKTAMRSQHSICDIINPMEQILSEEYGMNLPNGVLSPGYFTRVILRENTTRCKEEKIKRPSRIHPNGKPGDTIWSRTAIALWFEHGGYFKDSKMQKEWLSWIRGSEKVVCECCGETESIELHHKDGNHYNNYHFNHAIVCPTCHEKVDKKIIEHIVPEMKY